MQLFMNVFHFASDSCFWWENGKTICRAVFTWRSEAILRLPWFFVKKPLWLVKKILLNLFKQSNQTHCFSTNKSETKPTLVLLQTLFSRAWRRSRDFWNSNTDWFIDSVVFVCCLWSDFISLVWASVNTLRCLIVEAAWPSVQGAGLEIRRSRVRVPFWPLSWSCFSVAPSSTPRSCMWIPNWSASHDF